MEVWFRSSVVRVGFRLRVLLFFVRVGNSPECLIPRGTVTVNVCGHCALVTHTKWYSDCIVYSSRGSNPVGAESIKPNCRC